MYSSPRTSISRPSEGIVLVADLRVRRRVDEDVHVVEGRQQLDGAAAQEAVAEHVAAHVADADRGDDVGLRVDAHLAEVPLGRLPRAAGGDAGGLVVVAVRAARREGVVEPELAR